MAKTVRYLVQVVPHLEKKYGSAKAQAVMAKALRRYDALVEENKDEPKAYYMHTRQRIYPAIAVFDAMTDAGIAREEAAGFVIDYYKWRSSGVAPKIRAAFRIPGLYKLVPRIFYKMTGTSFGPQAGFAFKDGYVSKTEMRFNMVKCPYLETCRKYGCPEIVRGFCDADDICYGNMHPKLSWDRTGTLGYGNEVCDFRIHIRE